MSTESEIVSAIGCLESSGAQFALLHCNSTYPTPMKDINLAYLSRLKSLCRGRLIGYSGHERGFLIPVASIAMGAKIVEKHLTLDRSMEGSDHRVSLLPSEFRQMVADIRTVEEAIGGGEARTISQGELMNRESLSKSLVADTNISTGSVITREMVVVRSPGRGLQPNLMDELIGKRATRDFRPGDFFYKSDLLEKVRGSKRFTFSRQWGLPVRFHDCNDMLELTPDLKLVEFHLSYKDLYVDLNRFEPKNTNIELIVHAPELFEDDHLLDLASLEDGYRQKSIENLKRLILFCRQLKSRFKKQGPIKLVINVGGFSLVGFDASDTRKKKYSLLAESLKQVDLSDISLLPQTMPPFPWHFGGQSHHNLFVRPNEILRFCEKNGLKICLDVSHSALACNYFGTNLTEFIDSVGHLVDHMHVADAEGVDGEGLPIGSGGLDFHGVASAVSESVPRTATWIPEVWQGHKNNGEGFLEALEKLSKYANAF